MPPPSINHDDVARDHLVDAGGRKTRRIQGVHAARQVDLEVTGHAKGIRHVWCARLVLLGHGTEMGHHLVAERAPEIEVADHGSSSAARRRSRMRRAACDKIVTPA